MSLIKMIALDLDGTLAQNNHEVLPETRDALEALHDSGVEVVIATGRRYRSTRFVIDNLGFEVFAVCNGGALVKTPTLETLHETTFNQSQLASLVDIARGLDIALIAQRDAHSRGGPDFVIDDQAPWSAATSHYFKDNLQWSSKGDLAKQPEEFLVAALHGEERELRSFADAVQRQFPNDFTALVVPFHSTGQHYCEVTQTHVDKWHGLGALCRHFDIAGEQLCTVGDELNDLPMLTAATHSFAMGNGNPEVQKQARFTCGAHDANGILEVIDYIRSHNQGLARQA